MLITKNKYARRMGIITIPAYFFELYQDTVKDILSHMLVVRAELKDFGNGVEYHAYSMLFPEVKSKGGVVPIYEIEMNIKGGKLVGYGIVKRKS